MLHEEGQLLDARFPDRPFFQGIRPLKASFRLVWVEGNFQNLHQQGLCKLALPAVWLFELSATVHHGTRSCTKTTLRSPPSIKARIWLFHIPKARRTSFA